MKQIDKTAITKDLVLLGGGHSHLFVLRHFAMHPVAGARLTLVTRELNTPYSGMLPGFMAGHYDHNEVHIDLQPLARFAQARIIHGEVTALDTEQQQITIQGRPAISYDLLSINVGSRPSCSVDSTGEKQHFAVKPVDRFIESWRELEQGLLDSDMTIQLAIIGAGAGGVELALSLEHRARHLTARKGQLKITLVTDQACLLATHNSRVRSRFEQILRQRSIDIHYLSRVDEFDGEYLHGNFEQPIPTHAAIWTTHASPASWLTDSGLQLDQSGFIAVSASLQSCSHESVFAAGDIASVAEYPRPKSGVFAVRQGIPLARNLSRYLKNQKPEPFKPQTSFLSLISSGDRSAIASRGEWQLQGRWCWWLKDKIDRRFVRRFSDLPRMDAGVAENNELSPMRCGGCGSKLGRDTLESVLARIDQDSGHNISETEQYPDDAALIEVPESTQLVQSVDQFRSFVDDAYLFGRIAANHALGDLFAMGVAPHSAMVTANVEFGSSSRQAEDLYQLMSGVMQTLQQNDTLLVGGHSGEAAEMSCGLSVNGFSAADKLLLKSGMQAGNLIILTRALGSGVLFAADMQAAARGEWVDHALVEMQLSSREAADCLRQYSATACTDVTGFGLAGHLFEMARASATMVEIMLDRLPLYPGVLDLSASGFESSLKPQNSRIRHSILDQEKLASNPVYPILFDPQTAGGLLASVPVHKADDCLQKLHQLGYNQAQVIARVSERSDPDCYLSLTNS